MSNREKREEKKEKSKKKKKKKVKKKEEKSEQKKIKITIIDQLLGITAQLKTKKKEEWTHAARTTHQKRGRVCSATGTPNSNEPSAFRSLFVIAVDHFACDI